jgi:hypothetical protein
VSYTVGHDERGAAALLQENGHPLRGFFDADFTVVLPTSGLASARRGFEDSAE